MNFTQACLYEPWFIFFLFADAYPSEPPVIAVRSEALSDEDIEDLTTYLTQTAQPQANTFKTLEDLVNHAVDWLKEEHISLKGKKMSPHNSPNKQFRKKGKKPKKKFVDKEEKPKKPPMKTAIDVVKRIQWDKTLPIDQFIVGYIDRMEGLKEKYFTAFSWEDIASVDYTVLAIPKHRIQYFKYKTEIVWDKRNRLDNVFGSTGSKLTIYNILAKDGIATNLGEVGEENDNEEDADWGGRHQEEEFYDSGEYSESDSDSDDGIEVNIGGGVGGMPVYMGGYNEDGNPLNEEVDGGDNGQFDKYWRDKLRPNYFFALRITDDNLRNQLEEVQNYIINEEPALSDCKIPRGALHMTLTTVGLETSDKVNNASETLRDIKDELSSIVPKTKPLMVSGVGNFFNRVIYAKIKSIPEIDELVEHLKLCLNEKGIDIRDYHEFIPHITLMKISRPVGRLTGKKYISPWLYSCFAEKDFGEQVVDNVHLCAMTDDRQDDGFYISAGSHSI